MVLAAMLAGCTTPEQRGCCQPGGQAGNRAASTAKPDRMSGWQFSAGMYYDHITPQAQIALPDFDQFIFDGHLVYHNAHWEFLAEGYLLDDMPVGGEAHYSPMAYGQISRKFHRFTPYARFTYYNASKNDAHYSIVWN
jgi:hypothetical protein